MSPLKAIVGICAYNEENNISRLLQNLVSKQDLSYNYRILVICSGCTDRTPEIVKEFQQKDSRIDLITENERKGKSHALNRIFRHARSDADLLILTNADALPAKESIRKLQHRLTLWKAGAVFARPVPLEDSRGISHRIVQVIWRLHDIISILGTPKLSGELCAIRASCLEDIPENTVTDEPFIEMTIHRQHQSIRYVPEAIVHIRCPTNVSDLMKQRKRNWIGHMQLQDSTGYKVPTSDIRNILRAASALTPKEIPYLLLGGFLEAIVYVQARAIFRKGMIPYAWEPIRSTKTSL